MIAILCSVIGVFLVLRRMSMLGDGFAHISFAGIAFGLLFNIYPLFSALVISVISAFGIQKLRRLRVHGDAAIAIMFSFGLALGVLVISMADGFNADLFSYLFGSILSVSVYDIALIVVLGVLSLTAIYFLYKELVATTFDEDYAKASGINAGMLDTFLVVISSVLVVLSLKIVGILLVSSFMVIPASSALLLRKGFKETMLFSACFAVLSVVLGLCAAYVFDLPAGGAIVMVLALSFVVSLVVHYLRHHF